MAEELHPNWRALATVHLQLKRFIKASDAPQNSFTTYTHKHKNEIRGVQGEEAKEFYDQILAEKTKTKTVCQKRPKKSMPNLIPTKNIVENKVPFDRHKFFLYAQQNNADGLRNFEPDASELNCTDEFGWTALMVAACEGAVNAVKILLQWGADKTVKDKGQNTASDLARKKGHLAIVEMLDEDLRNVVDERKEKLHNVVTPSPFYCEICQRSFNETTISAHQTSTIHQFNVKSTTHPNKLERFNIPHRNRGLKLMVKQGWDKESGLGPTQNGRLYPVKTVIRNQRTGLGIEQPPPRVTHFEAFDLRAIKRRSVDYCSNKRNRNDIRREKIRDWKRNRRLRNELS